MTNKLTQRERALLLIRKIENTKYVNLQSSPLWLDLEELVAETQNGPPDGGADSTISEPMWYALRDFSEAVMLFQKAVENVKVAIK